AICFTAASCGSFAQCWHPIWMPGAGSCRRVTSSSRTAAHLFFRRARCRQFRVNRAHSSRPGLHFMSICRPGEEDRSAESGRPRFCHFSTFSIAAVISGLSGVTRLSKYCTDLPSALTTYLLKFHFGSLVWAASALNTGLAFAPFTLVVDSIVKVTPLFTKHTSAAFSSSAASWLKSLDEKPTTARPLSLYFSCTASRPLNCGVKPQWLAVFTISMGLPAKSLQRFTFCEECSLRNSWSRKA